MLPLLAISAAGTPTLRTRPFDGAGSLFGADGLLGHLDEKGLALLQDVLDVGKRMTGTDFALPDLAAIAGTTIPSPASAIAELGPVGSLGIRLDRFRSGVFFFD